LYHQRGSLSAAAAATAFSRRREPTDPDARPTLSHSRESGDSAMQSLSGNIPSSVISPLDLLGIDPNAGVFHKSLGEDRGMSSFTRLIYHLIFSTKYRQPLIRESIRDRLYEYTGGAIRAMKGHLIEIGGVEDHVHLLVNLPPTQALSDMIRELKANSSKWLNELRVIPGRFGWQKGYACFTASYSQTKTIRRYIQNQKEHHKQKSFQDEYIEFLKRHEIEFDERYLFEGEFHA
jgi:putative transposase